jgi:cation diffusion facilitator family transporter
MTKDENFLLSFTKLSIFASLATISLKFFAYFLTGSVGLLSDGIESFVNLVAASFAFFSLKIAQKPADKNHPFGHSKAEYFSSALEGGLIFIAALVIIVSAINRLIHPQPLEKISLGIILSSSASLINLFVGLKLISVGKKYHSITLEADGNHLLTDVWTSAGVILAIFIVALTNWQVLDPLIAIFVALNILLTGTSLIKRSALGFMDTAISDEELNEINQILKKYEREKITFHQLRTRLAGQKRFISFHLLFPDSWSIKKSHDIATKIEKEIKKKITNALVDTHLEPISDLKK